MKPGEVDETGRRRPLPIEGSEFFVEADMVIPAVGQAPDLSFLPEDTKLERARWGALQVNPNTMATNLSGIFAGGDFVTGPTTVIQAIAAGRTASLAIDKYFRGDTTRVEIRDEKCEVEHEVEMAGDREDVEEQKQVEVDLLPPDKRIMGFMEIEMGYTEEKAKEEAKRCLRCDRES